MSKTIKTKMLPMVISNPKISKILAMPDSRKLGSLSPVSWNIAIPRRGIIAAKLKTSANPEKSSANTVKILRFGYAFKK